MGFNIFLGSKTGKHLQLCGRAHYRSTRKNLESRTQLDEPVECASGGDPLLLYKIPNLLFFPLVWILCALRLESRKKLSTWSWCGTFEISFYSAEGMSWQDVTRSSLCSGVKECGTKRAHNFPFPNPIQNPMFKDSAIILYAIRRSYLTK